MWEAWHHWQMRYNDRCLGIMCFWRVWGSKNLYQQIFQTAIYHYWNDTAVNSWPQHIFKTWGDLTLLQVFVTSLKLGSLGSSIIHELLCYRGCGRFTRAFWCRRFGSNQSRVSQQNICNVARRSMLFTVTVPGCIVVVSLWMTSQLAVN